MDYFARLANLADKAATAEIAAAYWPPVRPNGGLLAGAGIASEWDFLSRPRDEWTADEWRRYAERMEQAGHTLARELVEARLELARARAKASRKANLYLRPGLKKAGKAREAPMGDTAPFLAGLLTPRDLPKRGRPTGSQWKAIAEAADEVLAAAKKRGNRMKKHEAVNEVLRSLGRRSLSERETRTAQRLMKPATRRHNKVAEVT